MELPARRRSIWDLPDGTGDDSASPAAEAALDIPLERLWANPFNPRLIFDDEEIDAMAESIKSEGILQDLMVAGVAPFLRFWKPRVANNPTQSAHLAQTLERAKDDDYVILIGHNRHAACARADLTTAPCRVRNDKIERARILGLPENLRRVKLNPIEEAVGFHGAIEDGLTQAEIAAQVGCKQPHVSRRLKLLQLGDDLRDAVMAGTLRTTDAEAIAAELPLNHSDQQLVLKLMHAEGLSAPVALAAHRRRASAELAPPTSDLPGQRNTPASHDPAPTPPDDIGTREDTTAEARVRACHLILAAETAPSPRELVRLLAPALIAATPAGRVSAARWLSAVPQRQDRPPGLPDIDHADSRESQTTALAIALATLEHRAQSTPRPWSAADRHYIQHLIRHAGYQPNAWEQRRMAVR
jgi:ParB/RepB/Spo0J family partition protein